MSNVKEFPQRPGVSINTQTCVITATVLRVDGKKMTRSFFRQIPWVILEEWPKDWLGWVRDGGPWLVWVEPGGRLVRSNICEWERDNGDGTSTPVTDYARQLYIG